jgi:methionine-rich copper-binding protein CopC
MLAVAAAVIAGGLAVALVAAPPASAHSALVASTPAEGETLAELPPEFSVTMNETLLASAGDAAFALRVRDDAGRYYGDGCLTIVDATVSTPAAIGASGDYVMEWQVVSADGHAVGGEILFTWTGEATAEGTADAAVCGELPGGTTDEPSAGHHGAEPSPIPVGDVLWIVGAVFAVAAAVTVALIATRRKK